MLMTTAEKKFVRNAKTVKTGENGKNDKNEDKNKNLKKSLI